MTFLLRISLLCLLLAVITGCAQKTLVALVPDPDGEVGKVTVSTAVATVHLSAPYQATTVPGATDSPEAPEFVARKRLERMFSDALSIERRRALYFVLCFVRETEFKPGSVKTVPGIVAAIRQKGSSNITVVGYADTLGSKEWNAELSVNRALAAKELLVSHGVDPSTVWTFGQGEESLLIPTRDEVWEPRNRCAEVIVR